MRGSGFKGSLIGIALWKFAGGLVGVLVGFARGVGFRSFVACR